jgi:PAB-dependent poly(A)-specific ribonuclease subunit 3
MDILQFDGTPPTESHMTHFQQEDLLFFANLITCLASGTLVSPDSEDYSKAMSSIVSKYSEDLMALLQYLLRAQQLPHSISGAMQFVAPKLLGVVNVLHLQQDRLENELLRELENGRLFRLLSKLGVINERPELVCAI